MKYFLPPLLIVFVLLIAVILIVLKLDKKLKRNKKVKHPHQKQNTQYYIKSKYISNCELQFYYAIKNIIGDKYVLFPQVPLSQIIIKKSNSKYQNELYRVMDFCIFSKDYTPLICIEINDETHRQKERYIRDKKVEAILNNAGLPLITLWTEYGVKYDYIKNRISNHIEL